MRDLSSHAVALTSPPMATSGHWDVLRSFFGFSPPLWLRVLLVVAFLIVLGLWIWSLARGDDE